MLMEDRCATVTLPRPQISGQGPEAAPYYLAPPPPPSHFNLIPSFQLASNHFTGSFNTP